MNAGIFDKTISTIFYQNSFIKVKVDRKNSKRSQSVLGLTSLLCSKTSKVLKKLQVYQFWELKLTNTLVSSATFCVPGQ